RRAAEHSDELRGDGDGGGHWSRRGVRGERGGGDGSGRRCGGREGGGGGGGDGEDGREGGGGVAGRWGGRGEGGGRGGGRRGEAGRITVRGSDGQLSTPTSFGVTVTAAPTGLVAAYGFNEGAGTVLTDISGNGNTGTISGATWTTAGKFGGALQFNGTNA